MTCKNCGERVKVKAGQSCLRCHIGKYVEYSDVDRKERKLTCSVCLHRMLRAKE